MEKRIVILLFVCSLFNFSCTDDDELIREVGDFKLETIASGFDVPWAIEVIDEDEYLITDRTGKLYYYGQQELTEVENIPASRSVTTDLIYGGLMDVRIHPEFSSNKFVYIAYVNLDYRLSVARFQLLDKKAENLQVIFRANEFSIGSRIEWEDNDHFYLSIGVGGSPYPEPGPQNLNSDRGKIHRLTKNGGIPADNPIFPGKNGPTSIWSYGHRNPQGLFFDEDTRLLYANEHGPLGGDELNVIEKGGNYGWPLFSYGLNYDNTPVSNMSEEEAKIETILPLKYWGPDFRVAPSSLIKLSNSNFSEWNDTFLIGALFSKNLISYHPDTDATKTVLKNIGRVRDIAQLPSGDLLISIDKGSPRDNDEGRLVRISLI